MHKVKLEDTEVGPEVDPEVKSAVEKWYEKRGGTGAMEDMAECPEPFSLSSEVWHAHNEYIIIMNLDSAPGWKAKPIGGSLRKREAEQVVRWFNSVVENQEKIRPEEIQNILSQILQR